ncbi:TonB-dependent receptor [Mesoterricola silvestris]|nr:carboxypeptidase regulatory-like domain-containing protein [Mesoterricola silvestris]
MVIVALPASAQQAGAIFGRVTAKDGKPLAGIHVDASGNVLPQGRLVVTNETGEYRLPFLPPGEYTLVFTHPNRATEKRKVVVALQQTTTLHVTLNEAAMQSTVVEVVGQASMVDASSAELKTLIASDVLTAMPVGVGYRDMMKLIPGVAYTSQGTRDPNAGGSGQDNVHLMDGVNVNLPMYGTIGIGGGTASYDIDQIAVTKGGASATDFNRSAGFTMNSISKSGTNVYTGELSYTAIPANLVARRPAGSTTSFETDSTYAVANVGGPIVKERLFFFASMYSPKDTRKNGSNLYGPVPELSTSHTEYFGKLTYSPTTNLLLHGSYRRAKHTDYNVSVGSSSPASVANGAESTTTITTLEASWSITPNNFLNFKYTNFAIYQGDHPNTYASATAALDGSSVLDVNNLATQGNLSIPTVAQAGSNATLIALINRYGYAGTGTNATPAGFVGGGSVGVYPSINTDNFFRRNYQLAWDGTYGSTVSHEVHVGFQYWKEMEDLYRISNGWGSIAANFNNQKIPTTALSGVGLVYAYVASPYQQGLGHAPQIHSELESQNFEVNDRIRWNAFTFNVGVLVSNDKLYGMGIRTDSTTAGGYALAPGQKYLEHEIKWADTLQPRLGVTWNYHKDDTIYANFARYVPSTSSLPRASSWARNLVGTINVYFDATGHMIGQGADAVSQGKLYVDGIKPRHTDEFMVGTTRDFGQGFTGRLYGRYRKSINFWEDTPNNSRVVYNAPSDVPHTLYIPDLATKLSNLGANGGPMNGNTSAVIAQLDGAFTKFYEVCAETEWRRGDAYASFSYTWSHYYGNFDQDNTANGSANDLNLFIGSSNIADSAGTQIWDNKYGNLAGDQRHKIKLFGSYAFPWNGKLGVYAVYQTGMHWQKTDYKVYQALITATGSTSTSDTARYAEPAGSRVNPAHYQMDLSYTQTFWQSKTMGLSGTVDLFNVFNRQTVTAYNQSANGGLFASPQTYMPPRRTQFGLRFWF